LAVNALFRLRAAQGVLGLADRHGAGRLERACAKAIAAGDPSYRTVKNILAAKLEADPPPPATGDGGAAAFLHGPARLFENVVGLPNPNPASVAGTQTSSTQTSSTQTSSTQTSSTQTSSTQTSSGTATASEIARNTGRDTEQDTGQDTEQDTEQDTGPGAGVSA
jgi:hypothetical protein